MTGPQAARLPGDRLHLQHGPIDLVISVDGPGREAAFHAAARRFATVLEELAAELPHLRLPVPSPLPGGSTARRMHRAVTPHASTFVTPMAAVAGGVADEILAAMTAVPGLTRAVVNNGGDIAFHLAPGEAATARIAGLDCTDLGQVRLAASDPIRGLATSGQGGRSHSLGIADSVTALATTAAEADVAATLIANAVDLPGHPAISRAPAQSLDPDSDLGTRPVVTAVGPLTPDEVVTALKRGLAAANAMRKHGLIAGAALTLGGQTFTALPTEADQPLLTET
ncbi:UPF0280 family protein [Ovoidimarina sediminis]|uniref:UPF0280 family protein n=1 Tax=Ovoidimarina sediminis TaxID=3079856 RepID=UPI002908EDF7|nr:UPF0280 family protein [Rhodophyticola sp. MJ-SS7]MDU8943291.1 UPF0280 family protein [Rhodophyticola sp. MJ-SS7]